MNRADTTPLRISAETARLRILRHLNTHAADILHTLPKSTLGYVAFPDRRFRAPQGAAFSVAKLVHDLENERLVSFYCGSYGRGYYLTSEGQRYLAALAPADATEATSPAPPVSTERAAGRKQHLTPCQACPWRTTSLKGWLGESTPLQFLAQAEAEIKMPCHCAVDYEREDWKDQVATAPRCAGHAVYLRNRCKRPKDPELDAFVRQVAPDPEHVFSRPEAFVAHHGGDVSRVTGVLLGMDTGD